jgi:hypothetical protein
MPSRTPKHADPKEDQKESQSPSSTDANKTIIIAESATVPEAGKDWWFRAYVIFTGLLVAIGGFGVRAAYRTLKAIEAQVVAQNEGLRARLTVGVYDNPFKRNMQEKFGPKIVVKLINTGGTPASKIVPESWIEVCPVPFSDFTGEAVYHKGEPIIVYPDNPIPYPVPLGRILTDYEKKRIWDAKCCICVRIRLTYDTIGGEKFCDFAYTSWPMGVAIISKYHDAN